MRRRVRNLIIALTAAVSLFAVIVGTAAATPAVGTATASVFAGGGNQIVSTAGTPAKDAQFNNLYVGFNGLATDGSGNVAIGDTYSNVVDLMPGANCTTDCPFGLGPMQHGDVYVVTGYGSTVPTGTTGVPLAKASLGGGISSLSYGGVQNLAFDPAGDLVIADNADSQVYLISARNCSQSCPYGLPSMQNGYVYLIAGANGLGTAPPFNGIAARQANLGNPEGVAFDGRGDIIIADEGNNQVYLAAASACSSNCPFGLSSMVAGHLYTIAGTGAYGAPSSTVLATSSPLGYPIAVTVDPFGNLFIGQLNGRVHFVPSQNCSSNCPYSYSSFQKDTMNLFETLNTPESIVIDPAGDVLISDYLYGMVQLYSSVNCSADCPYNLPSMQKNMFYTVNTTILNPMQMALSPSGTLYVSNEPNDGTPGTVYQINGGAILFKVAVTGTGTVSGGGTSCTSSCTTVHGAGTGVMLTPKAASGYLFAGWASASCAGAGTCTATVQAGATAKAVFRTRSYLSHRLRRVARKVSGRRMSPRQIWRHKGFRVGFRAAAARKVVIAWRIKRGHRSVLVAIGHRVPARVGIKTHLKIKLTKRGRHLLSPSRTFRATEIAKLKLGKGHKTIKLKRRITV